MTWANQVRILGQNFQRLGAAIGSGFVAWLRPMIVTINNYMDAIIEAVQRVVNALGRIFGWEMIIDTTGESLIDDTEGVADAWDDATGAAKKYAKQLLGIDELNNLTTNDKGSGSGDLGASGGLGGGNNINLGGIQFKPFESDIVGLYQLGTKISNKLRDLLSGINWEEIYEKAKNFGKGFASFLNGLIKPDLFYELGKTIASTLNTAILSILEFGKEGRWDQWGESIASGVNGFFENFKWSDAAEAINTWVDGLFKMLKTAIAGDEEGKGGINWESVFSGLYDFFSNIKLSSIGIIASTITVASVAKWVFPMIQQMTVRAGIIIAVAYMSFEGGKKLGEFLNPEDKEIYATFNWDQLNGVNPFEALNALKLAILDFKNNKALQFSGTILFGPIGETAKVFADMYHLAVLISDKLDDIDTSIVEMGGVGNVILTSLYNFFVLLNDNIFGNGGVLEEILTNVSFFMDDVSNTIQSKWDEFVSWFENTALFSWWNSVLDVFGVDNWTFSGIKDGLVASFENALSAIKTIWNKFADYLNEKLMFEWDAVEVFGQTIVPAGSIDLGKIPKFEGYAQGGFPEQGSLFVAGETYGQSEWVGNINGKTGVVSGNEITGIADAIYQTSSEEIAMLRQQNNLLQGILQKEFGISQNDIGKAARAYGRDFYNRTGNTPYVYN